MMPLSPLAPLSPCHQGSDNPELASFDDEQRVAAWLLMAPQDASRLLPMVSPLAFVFPLPRAVYAAVHALAAAGLEFDMLAIERWLRTSPDHPSYATDEIMHVTAIVYDDVVAGIVDRGAVTGLEAAKQSASVVAELTMSRAIHREMLDILGADTPVEVTLRRIGEGAERLRMMLDQAPENDAAAEPLGASSSVRSP